MQVYPYEMIAGYSTLTVKLIKTLYSVFKKSLKANYI